MRICAMLEIKVNFKAKLYQIWKGNQSSQKLVMLKGEPKMFSY